MRIVIKGFGFTKYIVAHRYNAIELFFAMQAMAIAERYHVFFGVLVLFLGFVISVVLEGRVANDA